MSSYPKPIELTIAWHPYKDQVLQRTSENEWAVVKSDSSRAGKIPVILIRYPGTQDSLLVEMNTESALFGKLLKHSLMTQEPISHPFGEYFEKASCTNCHPKDVEVDFNK